MRLAIAILLLFTVTARAQFFTPSEVQWLDFRYMNADEWTNILAGLTNVVTADGNTITNNGSGQFSVPLYDSNTFARVAYRQRTRDSLWDYLPGHINDATLGEMTNGGPLALTLQDMLD